MSDLIKRIAAAVAAKASATASADKSEPLFVPVHGTIKRDIWGSAINGEVIIERFMFDGNKLLNTDQQIFTKVKDSGHREVTIKRLEKYTYIKNGVQTKKVMFRKHKVRLSKVVEGNNDFLEGSCRDRYKMTVIDGTDVYTYSGATNRVTWEYITKPETLWVPQVGKVDEDDYVPGFYETSLVRTGEVQISYQRLEEYSVKDHQVYFIVSPKFYRDAKDVIKVRYIRLPLYKKEGQDTLFFNSKEDVENWEAWYNTGGDIIEWDVNEYVVLWAENYDDFTDVFKEWEKNAILEWGSENPGESVEVLTIMVSE